MSTRTNLRPHQVITSGDMSADITSEVTILQSLTKLAYQFSWSGASPVGDMYFQLSNDYQKSPDGKTVLNAGTWTNGEMSYNGSVVTAIPVSGNTGSGIIEVTTSAYAVRLFYDAGSGTGTMNSTAAGKVS